MPSRQPSDSRPSYQAPADSPGVIDLLGALAYGELSAFDHLADDAGLAPSLETRARISAMAAAEYSHYERLAARLIELGTTPEAAMTPFVAALESYHDITKPSTWPETVVKAYLGDGLAGDFYREVAEFVDDETGALIRAVLDDGGRAAFAIQEVRLAVEAQPSTSGRLALWGRRLVGEAISQTQHVLADHDSLTELLMQGAGDLTSIAGLITRVTDRHTERMASLGLSG